MVGCFKCQGTHITERQKQIRGQREVWYRAQLQKSEKSLKNYKLSPRPPSRYFTGNALWFMVLHKDLWRISSFLCYVCFFKWRKEWWREDHSINILYETTTHLLAWNYTVCIFASVHKVGLFHPVCYCEVTSPTTDVINENCAEEQKLTRVSWGWTWWIDQLLMYMLKNNNIRYTTRQTKADIKCSSVVSLWVFQFCSGSQTCFRCQFSPQKNSTSASKIWSGGVIQTLKCNNNFIVRSFHTS